MWSFFWEWYERNYALNISIAAFLFLLQVAHLIWLLCDVIWLRIFGSELLSLEGSFRLFIILVDYTEIPAIISVSLVYVRELRAHMSARTLLYLGFLNVQWLHLFWLTDEMVVASFAGSAPVVLPLWLAWLAIVIDYLEVPVMVDVLRKFLRAVSENTVAQFIAAMLRDGALRYTNRASVLLAILLVVLSGWVWWSRNIPHEAEPQGKSAVGLQLSGGELRTDFSKRSISLDLMLDGGPGKDGIPALVDPPFVSADEAQAFLSETDIGMLVAVGEDVRFYPRSILLWHEVVNDVVGGKPLVVTFCPLCGSAVVFEARERGGDRDFFGVSGKLYESNLLMYGRATESLWSQVRGEAVVGERIGEKLTHYPLQMLSLKEARAAHPSVRVLSVNTGYQRAYDFDPYGEYDPESTLAFPVSRNDHRLPAGEIVYAVSFRGHPVAFKLKDLRNQKAKVMVGGGTIFAESKLEAAKVTDENGREIPGFFVMWFSWAAHFGEQGLVWTSDGVLE